MVWHDGNMKAKQQNIRVTQQEKVFFTLVYLSIAAFDQCENPSISTSFNWISVWLINKYNIKRLSNNLLMLLPSKIHLLKPTMPLRSACCHYLPLFSEWRSKLIDWLSACCTRDDSVQIVDAGLVLYGYGDGGHLGTRSCQGLLKDTITPTRGCHTHSSQQNNGLAVIEMVKIQTKSQQKGGKGKDFYIFISALIMLQQ